MKLKKINKYNNFNPKPNSQAPSMNKLSTNQLSFSIIDYLNWYCIGIVIGFFSSVYCIGIVNGPKGSIFNCED
jgi:hypothetical protein